MLRDSWALTAVASDDLGVTSTSAPVHVTMARYLPAITNGEIAIFLLPIATNLAAPDYAISPPGDTNRLFVVEQNGLLRVIQNGTLLPEAALDIQSRVQPPLNATNANDERGFLGLAFHPGFTNPANNGNFRVTAVSPDSTLGNVLATSITVDRPLVPELAGYAGWSFGDLVRWMVEDASCNR